MEKRRKRKGWGYWAFFALCAVGGYLVGSAIATAGFELWPDIEGPDDLSVVAALGVSALYVVMAVLVAVGTISPRAGMAMEMFQDEDQWRDERELMWPSVWGTLPFALIPAVMVLAEPLGVIATVPALAIVALLVILTAWASLVSWRAMDELWRDVTRASAIWCCYLLFVVGGGWGVLAHFGLLAAPSPLDWLTLLYATALIAAVIAVYRRGMLDEGAP